MIKKAINTIELLSDHLFISTTDIKEETNEKLIDAKLSQPKEADGK